MDSGINNRKRVPKPVKRKQNAKKFGSGFVLLILAVILTVGGTLAYIITKTEQKDNTFTPGKVACEVVETFDKKVKSDVKIKNTGNTDAYIRAEIVVTWARDAADSGDRIISAKQPVAGEDYTIELNETDWIMIGGYYCHKASVAADKETEVLIKSCKPVDGKAPAGYHLSVEIIASAIQSDPTTAVTEKWGVTVENSMITGPAPKGE